MTTKITNLSANCDCEVTTGDETKVSIIVRGSVLYTTTVSSSTKESVHAPSISRDGVTLADGFTINYVDSSNITISGIIFDHNDLINLDSVKVS